MSAVAVPGAHRQLPLEAAAREPGEATERRAGQRCRADRDALVLDHLHLVDAVARRLRPRRTATTDQDDYRQAGRLALLRAAATWDPSRPNAAAFPTYAWRAITHEILGLQRAACRGPAAGARPLDSVLDPQSGLTVEETLVDPGEQPGDELLHMAHRMHVLTVLSRLPCRDRDLLRVRYINGFRVDVTAALLRLTVGQVQWRLQGATQRLAAAWQHAAREDPPARPRRAVGPPAGNNRPHSPNGRYDQRSALGVRRPDPPPVPVAATVRGTGRGDRTVAPPRRR